jgi:predicted nucleotidyltransferase
MNMIPLARDFSDFIRLLNARRVKYLLVGGYAVAYHGYPRATGDLDIFIELSERNARAMVKVFAGFGFDVSELTPDFFMDKGQVVRLGEEPLRLEIINDISGVTFSECYKNRVKAVMGGCRMNFIDLPDLMENKRASGRAKDLADLEYLAAAAKRGKSSPSAKRPPSH